MNDRELDKEISRLVFGVELTEQCSTFRRGRCDGEKLTHCGACGRDGHGNCYGNGTGRIDVQCQSQCHAPNYSSGLTVAFGVIEELRKRGYFVEVENSPFGWGVSFTDGSPEKVATGFASTLDDLPHQICLTAKAALEKS